MDIETTGFGIKLFISYVVSELKPKRSRIISSGIKLNSGSCLAFLIILPRVEKFDLIVDR